MKLRNKILSLFLSVIMILSLVPLTVSAAETSGTCGDNVTWSYNEETKTLTVSGTGDMKNYSVLQAAPWRNYKSKITSLFIEEGVTSIGGYSFSRCSELSCVKIPDSVMQINTFSFSECTNLEKIYIGSRVKKIVSTAIPKTTSIFYGGTLEQWQVIETNSQYSYISNNYGVHCADADFYPSGICSENLVWEFNDVTDTLSISGIGNMPDYKSESDAIDNNPYNKFAFRIKKVVLSDGITSIGAYTFCGFKPFMKVVIPNSVTSISSTAFLDWFKTYPVSIYYGGTVDQWRIIEGTFDYRYYHNFVIRCSDGYLPIKGKCGNDIIWEFDDLTGTLTISGCGAMYDYEADIFDYLSPWNNCGVSYGIKNVVVEDGVESIGNAAFAYCTALETVSFAKTIKTIGDYAFSKTSLKDVSINEGVVNIGEYAFGNAECIKVPYSVKNIGYRAFPQSVTICYDGTKDQWQALEKEHKYVFTSYSRAYCSDGELLPSGACGDNAFWVFDDTTGVLIISGTGDMYPCAVEDGYSAFLSQPWGLFREIIKSVVVEENITSIGSYAFYAFTSLRSIMLPVSIVSVEKYAFNGLSITVKDVYYSGSATQWGNIKNMSSYFTGVKIHYNSEITRYEVTCTSDGYVQYTCSCCEEGKTEVLKEATGHKYNVSSIEANCTGHGYTKHICESCGFVSTDYTSNPTGHTLNDEGICEVCGEKEVSTNHVNTQMLSVESVLAMVMSLLAKLFGIFTVA